MKPYLALSLLLSMGVSLAASAFNPLLNPGFEEDTDNVGYPDGWKLSKDAKVSLTRSDNGKSLVIEEGYGAVFQEVSIPDLAGRNVSLNLLARSPDAARLGVRIGCYVEDENGKKVWADFPMIWNKPLPPQFESLSANRTLPENALAGRFWICFYRSEKAGTVEIDEISLRISNEEMALSDQEWTEVNRELGYLRQKLAELKADSKPVNDLEKTLSKLEAEVETAEFSAISTKIAALRLQITRLALDRQPFTAELKEAYERIRPDRIPRRGWEGTRKVRLQGEYGALAAELVNGEEKPRRYEIKIEGEGLDRFRFEGRRQVLIKTWYTKGASLLADPLTLLPGEGQKWQVELEPGEAVRLHFSYQIPENAKGTLSGRVAISGPHEAALPFEIEVLPCRAPTAPALAHYQFLYTNKNVVNDLPEVVAKDLEAHGVTDIEWPFMPRTVFSETGEVMQVDWGRHTDWLKGFKDSPIRLNLFWEGSYGNLQTDSGGTLETDSAEATRAIASLMKAYLQYAATLGLGPERFTLLTRDEIHSAYLDQAPDASISRYAALAASLKAATGLRNYLTVGNYAFPADIEMALPQIDVALPHWPLPEGLKRNAPPEYNPRRAFFEETLPRLQAAKKERGLEIWSYHVFPGKSGNVLTDARAYPLLAVSAGFTGFGVWAYNVANGSTWDDTDGRLLDYILIYDGRENHPLNRRYNVTGEVIVPSIQWEALREGQQDGQILLTLLNHPAAQDSTGDPAVRRVIESVRKLGGKDGYGSDDLSFSDVTAVADELRHAYLKTFQSQASR